MTLAGGVWSWFDLFTSGRKFELVRLVWSGAVSSMPSSAALLLSLALALSPTAAQATPGCFLAQFHTILFYYVTSISQYRQSDKFCAILLNPTKDNGDPAPFFDCPETNGKFRHLLKISLVLAK